MADDGSGNDHTAQVPTFDTLNRAWWDWVNTNCLSKAKRVRGRWMHENVFTFDGTTWRRDRGTMKSNSGKTTYTTSETFFGGDGQVVHRGGGTILICGNDPVRNGACQPRISSAAIREALDEHLKAKGYLK